MLLSDLEGGRWAEAAAMDDEESWRRIVWSDFLSALALCALLGGLLAIASRCT